MIRKTTHVGARFSRIALVVAVSATLAACGGSSGDDDEFIDLNNNGINDADEVDFDEDFVDADMDGIDDSVDDFIDLDDNGINDADEVDEDPTVAGNVGTDDELTCSGETGTDPISGDDDWSNNCTVRRGAVHSTSYYTRGIQRIINCTGVDVATDAQFGPASELAVETYQTNEGLSVDGEVGPMTWGALRAELELLADDETLAIETWGVMSESCDGDSQFFRNSDPVTGDILNWRIADNPGAGIDEQVQFSVRNPFN